MSRITKSTQLLASDTQLAEPEETSAETMFFERLESVLPEAAALTDELRSYASVNDDIEIHFTSTEGWIYAYENTA